MLGFGRKDNDKKAVCVIQTAFSFTILFVKKIFDNVENMGRRKFISIAFVNQLSHPFHVG